MTPLDHALRDTLQCGWETPRFLFFSSEATPLVQYSHLLPVFATVVFLIFLIAKRGKKIDEYLLIVLSSLFAIFTLFDLRLWVSTNPSEIMFLWSLLNYIEPLLYLITSYVVLRYVYKGVVPNIIKYIFGLSYIPIILFGPTPLNLAGYDYTNCDRLAVEGLLVSYIYALEIFVILFMLTTAVFKLRKSREKTYARSTIYLTSGSILFLAALSSGNIFGTLFQETLGENAWLIGQYGLFGMPIFLGAIIYIIVKFGAFNSKLLATQALVLILSVLVGSVFFVAQSTATRVISVFTFLLILSFGYALIKSVKKEVEQREMIEKLAKNLQIANNRLKQLDKQKSEFVSIASHQLRSPLTSIAGYASLMREGTYGQLPAKMREPVERIEQSARFMAESIEDFLNVSRIESGNMKYHLTDFNLREVTEHICDDIRPEALRKGLVLLFKNRLEKQGVIHADLGKIQQILHNLINNSLKYTPKGTIVVTARDNSKAKRIYVDVLDTGIGMNEDTLHSIFQKFERGDSANLVNVKGTGLGLFVAIKMAEAMGGTITADSEGEGKGSRFTLELPLVM